MAKIRSNSLSRGTMVAGLLGMVRKDREEDEGEDDDEELYLFVNQSQRRIRSTHTRRSTDADNGSMSA